MLFSRISTGGCTLNPDSGPKPSVIPIQNSPNVLKNHFLRKSVSEIPSRSRNPYLIHNSSSWPSMSCHLFILLPQNTVQCQIVSNSILVATCTNLQPLRPEIRNPPKSGGRGSFLTLFQRRPASQKTRAQGCPNPNSKGQLVLSSKCAILGGEGAF